MTPRVPRIAVIGCGYWGKNLVRNFAKLGALDAVCDLAPEGLQIGRELAPGARVIEKVDDVFADEEIEAVAVATPAVTHAALARQAFERGKDVFVEKPMAMSVAEGLDMMKAAARYERVLMVGHLLEYHPAVLALRDLTAQNALGAIRYVYSNRLNFGKVRHEENALWSFAPHDIAVLLRLVGTFPEQVTCKGANFVDSAVADVTVSTLRFPENVHAHIFVSWLNPFKEQKLVVVGEDKMAVFDDVSRDEKLTLFNQHVRIENGRPALHKADKEVVPLKPIEPLERECREFLNSVRDRGIPLTDGRSGLRVLGVLEACERSMIRGGVPQACVPPDPQ